MPTNTRRSPVSLNEIILKINARRRQPVPTVLPWGTSLDILTVSEFLQDYKRHLRYVIDNLPAQGATRVTEANFEYLINIAARISKGDSTVTESQQKKMLEELEKIKRQQLTQHDDEDEEDTDDDNEEDDETTDPLTAVVILLLTLLF